MVFFTCNACGASLKKNQVEKHYRQKCRQCEVLTCIDCHKDFPGDSYQSHNSCITENEKYGGRNYQPKANANKGAKKQAAWLERLENLKAELGNSMDNDVKGILDAIQGYENIPRKRPKFINFCKNVLARKFHPSSIEKTWEIFEKALKEPTSEVKSETIESKNGKENGQQAEETASESENLESKKSKKRKAFEDCVNQDSPKKSKMENEEDSTKSKFDWIEVSSSVIAKKGSTKLKKLKKKVVNEYLARYPETAKSVTELESKLEKKLNKSKKFKVSNDVVSFSTSREENV